MLVKGFAKNAVRIARIGCRFYTNWPMLSEEHIEISNMCRKFAENELAPVAAQNDRDHRFPAEQIRKLGELGMMGVTIPSNYGGSGMDYLSYAIAMEEISRGCASTGVVMSVNNSLFCSPVFKYGNEDQFKNYLEPCASGNKLGCFMLSEPGNGSDAGAARSIIMILFVN